MRRCIRSALRSMVSSIAVRCSSVGREVGSSSSPVLVRTTVNGVRSSCAIVERRSVRRRSTSLRTVRRVGRQAVIDHLLAKAREHVRSGRRHGPLERARATRAPRADPRRCRPRRSAPLDRRTGARALTRSRWARSGAGLRGSAGTRRRPRTSPEQDTAAQTRDIPAGRDPAPPRRLDDRADVVEDVV